MLLNKFSGPALLLYFRALPYYYSFKFCSAFFISDECLHDKSVIEKEARHSLNFETQRRGQSPRRGRIKRMRSLWSTEHAHLSVLRWTQVDQATLDNVDTLKERAKGREREEEKLTFRPLGFVRSDSALRKCCLLFLLFPSPSPSLSYQKINNFSQYRCNPRKTSKVGSDSVNRRASAVMTRWKVVLQNEFSDFYELIPCKILMVLCIGTSKKCC